MAAANSNADKTRMLLILIPSMLLLAMRCRSSQGPWIKDKVVVGENYVFVRSVIMTKRDVRTRMDITRGTAVMTGGGEMTRQ